MQYDVVVCGLGSAGFTAAVAAARQGAKTAVLEKEFTPGGILTVGGNCAIDQFNNPFKSGDKMVIKGIGLEFVKKLEELGFAEIPDMYAPYVHHAQYSVKVNPVAAAKVMDDMLLSEGVDIYYSQPVVDVNVEQIDGEKHIKSVVISTKQGLKTIQSKVFIDTTGDGDLSAFAGANFDAGDNNGTFQPGTIRYYPAVIGNGDYVLDFGDNHNHVNKMDATDSDALTMANIAARRMLFEQMLNLKNQGQNGIMASAPMVAQREGRRIKGITSMNVDDFVAGKVFEDSICYSFWFVDIHRENEPALIKYITSGVTPTIRYTSMLPKGFENLITAGRCVSSDRETNSALRVKASCMAMGQAAGTAAALSAIENISPTKIDIKALKQRLKDSGAVVPAQME